MNIKFLRTRKKQTSKKNDVKKIRFYEAGLRTIGFLASLVLAGFAIHEHIDSPVVWVFLGYAIGNSSAGIKSI